MRIGERRSTLLSAIPAATPVACHGRPATIAAMVSDALTSPAWSSSRVRACVMKSQFVLFRIGSVSAAMPSSTRIGLAAIHFGPRKVRITQSGLGGARQRRERSQLHGLKAERGLILTDGERVQREGEYTGASFAVAGQVTQPGRFTFPRGLAPRMELTEAIAMSGGCTRLARQSRIIVKRGAKLTWWTCKKLATTPGAEHFTVIPNDVITVPERIF